MVLITLNRTLDLNFVDIVGIRVEPLVHVPNIKKNDNSQINRGSTIKINHFFITLNMFMHVLLLVLNWLICPSRGQVIISMKEFYVTLQCIYLSVL